MKKNAIIGIIVTLILLALAPAVFAGSWSGVVVNGEEGTPIYNVNVTAKLAGVVKNSALTGVNGSFTVGNLEDGSYTLSFTAYGYSLASVSGLPAINNSNPSKTDLRWPFNVTLQSDGTVCSQSTQAGDWSACSGSTQSRTVTYDNYQNICGYRYITSESQSCGGDGGDGGGGGRDGGGHGGGGSVVSDTFMCNGKPTLVTPNDRIIAEYNGKNYTLFVKDIVSSSVLMKLYPIPSRDIQINTGTTKEIDLDWNNLNDFKVAVSSARANTDANITCSLMTEKTPVAKEEGEKEEKPVVQEVLSNIKEGILNIASEIVPKEGASPIVGSVLALAIVVIGLLGYSIYRRSRESREDEFGV